MHDSTRSRLKLRRSPMAFAHVHPKPCLILCIAVLLQACASAPRGALPASCSGVPGDLRTPGGGDAIVPPTHGPAGTGHAIELTAIARPATSDFIPLLYVFDDRGRMSFPERRSRQSSRPPHSGRSKRRRTGARFQETATTRFHGWMPVRKRRCCASRCRSARRWAACSSCNMLRRYAASAPVSRSPSKVSSTQIPRCRCAGCASAFRRTSAA